ADFNTRAMFARNFFAAGGIEATGNEAPKSSTELIAAFKASGAKIACLCSSDEVYAREAIRVPKELMAAGARHVYLAGRPGKDLEGAGIGTFIFAGCDALAVLDKSYEIVR